jgi:hypothetical protein
MPYQLLDYLALKIIHDESEQIGMLLSAIISGDYSSIYFEGLREMRHYSQDICCISQDSALTIPNAIL